MERDYDTAIKQIAGVVEGESDYIANLSNIAAILKSLPGYFWVGFYIVKGKQLVLGPFQGPVACTRIDFGRGVCGTAWSEKNSQLVPDVHSIPNHIACNPNSKSEVVVPILDGDKNVGLVLDVDSDVVNNFSERDVQYLEKIADMISKLQTRNA
ncbi:MAG TPA: GAF domain-containing protein [Cryomorphaceae bacterium]|nr:GAF domain-containing protein [Cryomorphaceae bacterium]